MWFKNLCVYQLTDDVDLAEQTLIETLSQKEFKPLGKLDLTCQGWTTPLGEADSPIVHAVNGYIMICIQREEKILPAAAINELLNSRIDEIEQQQARKVRGKEKQNLKDEVILDMVPRAFSRKIRTYAYIDTRDNLIIVDSSSAKRAEDMVSFLRDTLGSLPVVPFLGQTNAEAIMTDWLQKGHIANDMVIDDECELRDAGDDGGIVRIRKHDLASEEVQIHLQSGKQVKKLAVTYDERMSLVLDATMEVKRLKFLDVIQDKSDNENATTYAEIFDSDFAIMTVEISQLLKRLQAVVDKQ